MLPLKTMYRHQRSSYPNPGVTRKPVGSSKGLSAASLPAGKEKAAQALACDLARVPAPGKPFIPSWVIFLPSNSLVGEGKN